MQFATGPDPTDLLTLPWSTALERWPNEKLVSLPRGISRHVVRFVRIGGIVYAIKEISKGLAEHEYELLRALAKRELPAVQAVGVVANRMTPDGEPLDAALVTKHLRFSLPYRALFSRRMDPDLETKLLDALAELLVRLHLAGFAWRDCSLSNTLFRRDAGALAAYLVDAETGELRESLSRGQRLQDLDIVETNVAGELLDLQMSRLLPESIDPLETAMSVIERYERLWDLLTAPQTMGADEWWRIEQRLRRLNELGFDVDELDIVQGPDGNRLRVRTRIAEPGRHRQLLFARTGIDAEENQARRLLNDIASFRGWQEQAEGRRVPETAAANRWLAEVYDPVIASMPADLRGRLDDAEVFHEILEHRWFLSEAEGRDVGTSAAAADYFAGVLPAVPPDLTVGSGMRGIIGP